MLDKEKIKWLSSEQQFLDSQIIAKHKLEVDEDMLNKKIIAFWVELGEYANEEKSFKYWKQGAAGSRQLQLEEYIDGLHFIISIGNQINFNFDQFIFKKSNVASNLEAYFDINEKITKFFNDKNANNYLNLLNAFLSIGVVQSMTEDELIETYKIKHQKNQQRQVDNY